MFAIDNFGIVRAHILGIGNVVTQFIKRLHDNAEGFPAVVTLEVFDVFEHKNRRTACVNYAHHIKKQRALRIAGKAMGTSEGVLFGHTGQRKRLTREARQQNIMRRNGASDMVSRFSIRNATFMA
ncbi:hypothetical protein D3C80_1086600 [compost metagenome]